MTTQLFSRLGARIATLALIVVPGASAPANAQTAEPEMLVPNLAVRVAASDLAVPTSLAFLGRNDFLVLEKNSGQVLRVVDGAVQGPVLDLAVNFGSERGLLGIALHPDFPENPGVYLYWTESTTGADTSVLAETPLLGNRVDRYVWDGTNLAFDRNLVQIRAIQQDAGQPERGNHNGGVLAFGQDGKLYVFIGDLGRRGQLQNLPCGPTADCPGTTVADDQFGGPEPDNAHLSGVILRLNDDGTTPSDNPFFAAGGAIGGEAGANIRKVFSYGHRNSFGLAIDPFSGEIWLNENGDDSFSELNRIVSGMNGGWIQIAGPVERIAQFKEIETTFGGQDLQQLRWPPTNLADTPAAAQARLFMLPGAVYKDPEFSWKWEVAPGGMGFLDSRALGRRYAGDLFVGAASPQLEGGYLFHFNLSGHRKTPVRDSAELRSRIADELARAGLTADDELIERIIDRVTDLKPGVNELLASSRKLVLGDQRLIDTVADNLAKHEITESERLLIGRNFGIVTDIETGPNGNLFVVSLSHGRVYEIFKP